ncbi:MAG: hypothetical protein R8K20_11900 [Gallionellaceae bacterium]
MLEEKDYEEAFDEFSGEEPVDNKSEAEPAKELAAVPDATAEPADPWADAPEDLRAEYESMRTKAQDFEHKHKSDVGRVSALQRELNEARQQPVMPPEKAAEEGTAPSLTALDEDMPEIAQDVRAMIEAGVKDGIDQAQNKMSETVDARFRPFDDEQKVRNEEQQYAALEAAHGDFRDIASDQTYWDWVNEQPLAVQTLAGSVNADEVSAALTIYKASNGQQTQQANDRTPTKRDKQLAAAASIPSRASNASAPMADDDYDAAFEFFANN